ncbi:peptidoglycan DD-metalloendopeptidase family protein [Sphaerisporangium sp. TRM90804]|uniref:peptidoglycan DD-metalloendopeptidase family protein n=1 Tax=Sphaerisporangium sp. TRM90804 TaxID=3031113 RepID=UPI00244ADE5F|nr:peptidoglycan DD-metalloendopeptidase family protein [Sphaerisporangium sp. TRM90804]MDH2429534.1 peptidoglycan DD-metalloendopeptidase family protein [Sphaerisporangium sp. TRM90804]
MLGTIAVTAWISPVTAHADDPQAAAGPRPLFQLPFPCGESWLLQTYPGHDDYDIDMTATSGGSRGRAIVAAYGGTVVSRGYEEDGGGNYLRIDHGDGWQTRYLHMIEPASVSLGESVSIGQQIGRVGTTGDSSGDHLHFEQLRDGSKVESWFDGKPSGITTDGSPEGEPQSGPVTLVSKNCDGRQGSASPLLAYDAGTTTVMYRWGSTGTAFRNLSTATHESFDLDNVGGRVAAGDVNGDGRDDTVMAHQNADGTFSFKVLLHGTIAPVNWYTSGPFDLTPVGNRLIVGDFDGNGRAEPILAYDSGTATILYRWFSTGASFSSLSTATYTNDLDNVAERVAAGDVDGDGKDDTVMAHRNPDGTFSFKVFSRGTNAPANWYTSGPFNLAPVGNRLVVGDWNGNGTAEPILAYDSGTATILYRWFSTGASFSSLSTATYTNDLDNVAERVAAGDVDGDGKDDTVMAHQNADDTFTYKVFAGGTGAPANWYTSGPFNLAPVGSRLLLGRWL